MSLELLYSNALEIIRNGVEYVSSTAPLLDPTIQKPLTVALLHLAFAAKDFLFALCTTLFYFSLIIAKLITLGMPHVSSIDISPLCSSNHIPFS